VVYFLLSYFCRTLRPYFLTIPRISLGRPGTLRPCAKMIVLVYDWRFRGRCTMPTRHASRTTKTKNSSGERHSYPIPQALCTSAYVPLHTQPPRLDYDYNATWPAFTITYTKPSLLLLSSNSAIAYLLLDHHAPQISANPSDALAVTPLL
jgi:hypothetical protein